MYGVFGRGNESGLLSLSSPLKGGLDVAMNGGLIYRAPYRWSNWYMKETLKPCFVVGDVKVIIFVGTEPSGLNYYGIMENHLIRYMCVL
jgi:hypothetical protein